MSTATFVWHGLVRYEMNAYINGGVVGPCSVYILGVTLARVLPHSLMWQDTGRLFLSLLIMNAL